MLSISISRAMATLLGLAVLATTGTVSAQDWPKSKPVSIVVGFGPGAFTDVIARVVAQKLGETTGGSFVVENKPGAGGNIATGQVKRAAPDGYTILVHSVAYAVNPSLYPNAGYDAVKDFVPLALGPRTPNIITVNPATPAKDLKELIELARKDKLNYASSGIGTTTHLSIERLKAAAKVDITQPSNCFLAIARNAGLVIDNCNLPARKPVEQCRLADIRATDDGHRQRHGETPGRLAASLFDRDQIGLIGKNENLAGSGNRLN